MSAGGYEFVAARVYAAGERYNAGAGLSVMTPDREYAEALFRNYLDEGYAVEVRHGGEVILRRGPSMIEADYSMRRALAATVPAYPHAWKTELRRNAAGRAFWFVSRFVSRTRVEYLENVFGEPRCFRLERDALAACKRANEGATA
jgi:hypothetical protein